MSDRDAHYAELLKQQLRYCTDENELTGGNDTKMSDVNMTVAIETKYTVTMELPSGVIEVAAEEGMGSIDDRCGGRYTFPLEDLDPYIEGLQLLAKALKKSQEKPDE